ncbi:pyridoxamine 5'-phosphate oxidase family protein [Nocardia salmonicida]|uniref:pyridoxamine 5'-phosphate oxidase family protein n=1 Tax=Nocardia salmonicida TaxID=53431 RepID=UPI0007A4DA65|nr:pyridoxamine 5'-phosphate oxidase family protein [Nocardia salmonicida]
MSAEPTLAQIQETIVELLRTEEITTLATVDAEGRPSASTMHIAGDGLVTYIHTFQYNRKHTQMLNNPHVSYVVSDLPAEGYAGRRETRSLQMQGLATLVTDPDEIQHAVQLSFAQFPWLADTSMYKNIKVPDQGQQVFYRITPTSALWADHQVRMLWRVLLEFSQDGREITAAQDYNAAIGRKR